MPEILDKIEWEISIPIFRNSIVLKQLGLAIGIPFGMLAVFLLIIKAYYGLILIAILLLATFLFIRVVWGGNYCVAYNLNNEGIHTFTMRSQAKRNQILNAITVVLGFFNNKPAVVGAGFLAQSRQDIMIRWRNIKKVSYYPHKHTIMIRGTHIENIAVFCNEDNYNDVINYIDFKCRE